MKRMIVPVTLVLSFAILGCTHDTDASAISPGTNVTLQKRDGVTIAGRLVEVRADRVVVETREGVKTDVARSDIKALRPVEADPRAVKGTAGTASAEPEAAKAEPKPAAGAVDPVESGRVSDAGKSAARPEYREVTVPAGTVLRLELRSSVGSATSRVEDPVHATLRRAITVNGLTALPAGTAVLGHVTNARRSARVKGRAQVGFRFTQVDLPGEGGRHAIRTSAVGRVAPGTKKRDAAEIGGGAVGGAIVGGIVGGGKGAAKGSAIGGAAGTGVVLATRGKEVAVRAGTPVSVRLLAPLTLRVPVK